MTDAMGSYFCKKKFETDLAYHSKAMLTYMLSHKKLANHQFHLFTYIYKYIYVHIHIYIYTYFTYSFIYHM